MTATLRPRRTCCVDEENSTGSHEYDVEKNMSFEDFQETVLEDHDETKKLRKVQRRSTLGCAVAFLGLCALLVFAVNKTLIEADASAARPPSVPVRRYQAPLHSQAAKRRAKAL